MDYVRKPRDGKYYLCGKTSRHCLQDTDGYDPARCWDCQLWPCATSCEHCPKHRCDDCYLLFQGSN
jgi:hypothetical protein